jgi:hypothetical protein
MIKIHSHPCSHRNKFHHTHSQIKNSIYTNNNDITQITMITTRITTTFIMDVFMDVFRFSYLHSHRGQNSRSFPGIWIRSFSNLGRITPSQLLN